MTIAEQLRKNQPQVYNALVDVFDLDMQEMSAKDIEQARSDPEDNYDYMIIRGIMESRGSVDYYG